MAGQTAFDAKALSTPNPEWTKRRTKTRRDIERLADHICTRTPPLSYGNLTRVYIQMVRRNYDALGTWLGGYEALTEMVAQRLIQRDGSL
ncbi:hypothetical protein AB4099_35050 [Bosea sp. 2KB_26]|uniref:hypothetical protein n=1 Tax=Bosea sp. 2KB_26 TaxID=3237475 RepID=UPI003F9099AD